MKIEFECPNKQVKPKISILLIDWSCRESFHTIDYLNNQTMPREDYELLWVEYYDHRAEQIAQKLKEYDARDKPPPLDKWILLGLPRSVHYHKHLLYNAGLVASAGKILTICDSDSVVAPTFIESILQAFQQDPNIILHMDEVRNNDRRFYPFNYPSVEEILGKGCINRIGETTTGMLDEKDTLHTRNYGACMSALRQDVICIGGFDEHIDYLGRICGPYDATFRLRNLGKQERWLEDQFVYHVWHPGITEDEYVDYVGPNDGRNISTTALEALETGRTMPLVENQAVRELRQGRDVQATDALLLPKARWSSWEEKKVRDKIAHVRSALLLEEGYKQFNILFFGGRFYGLSQGEGAFDIARQQSGEYELCLEGETIEEVKRLIDKLPACQVPGQELLEEGYRGFNILRFRGRFVALDQELGPVDCKTTNLDKYRRQGRCCIADGMQEVKRCVDEAISRLKCRVKPSPDRGASAEDEGETSGTSSEMN
ncbi:MAG: glycosyltransferase family 2 protein [Phycisphaerae bacterium]|nr:glycosyltransferase family 2 protein [Phycisphaerae bacterium]